MSSLSSPRNTGPDHFHESIHDATISMGLQAETKLQPWKASWPPKTEVSPGEYHGVPQGKSIEEDGSGGYPAMYPRF